MRSHSNSWQDAFAFKHIYIIPHMGQNNKQRTKQNHNIYILYIYLYIYDQSHPRERWLQGPGSHMLSQPQWAHWAHWRPMGPMGPSGVDLLIALFITSYILLSYIYYVFIIYICMISFVFVFRSLFISLIYASPLRPASCVEVNLVSAIYGRIGGVRGGIFICLLLFVVCCL